MPRPLDCESVIILGPTRSRNTGNTRNKKGAGWLPKPHKMDAQTSCSLSRTVVSPTLPIQLPHTLADQHLTKTPNRKSPVLHSSFIQHHTAESRHNQHTVWFRNRHDPERGIVIVRLP